MQHLINTYNNLDGKTVAREDLKKLTDQVFDAIFYDESTFGPLHTKLVSLLLDNPDHTHFKLTIANKIENTEVYDDAYFESLGIPYLTPELAKDFEEENTGLNKAVTPADIYDYITETVINTIEKVGELPWQREWKKTSLYNGFQALNYDTKKGYRGINYVMLNYEVKRDEDGNPYLTNRDLSNPYFLTAKSIKRHGGRIKKGATADRVVYFTKLYTYKGFFKNGDVAEYGTYNQKKFKKWIDKNYNQLNERLSKERLYNTYIPILKYYNVFNGAETEGIEFKDLPKNNNVDLPKKERIEIAENIVNSMPNKPDIKFGGDQPAYYPTTDHVLMTPIEAFNEEQSYYSTLFHELTHSTYHKKRLNDDTRKPPIGGRDEKNRAFEELIAELGAVFLCAESGILFSTLENSAKYLRGWNSKLVKNMKKDNKFFFRASSKSQAAADFILDRNKEGKPAYLKIESKIKPKNKKGSFVWLVNDFKNAKKGSRGQILTTYLHNNKYHYKVKLEDNTIIDALEENFVGFKAKPSDFKFKSSKKEKYSIEDIFKHNSMLLKQFEKSRSGKVINAKKHLEKAVSKAEKDVDFRNKLGDWLTGKTSSLKLRELMEEIGVDYWGNLSNSNAIDYLDSLNANKPKIRKRKTQPGKQLALLGAKQKQKKKDAPKGLKISINPIQIAPTTLTNQKPTVQPNTENMGVFSVAVPEVLDNTPKYQDQPKQEVVPTPTPKTTNNTIASKLSQQRTRQFFSLKPQFADLHTFLGKVERPAKESVVVTLSGPQGCGKTTAVFDMMNAFATSGYNVLHASLEEHPDSYLYEQKAVKYLSPEAQQRIKAPAYSSSNKAQILKDIEEADVIVIDSMKKMWQYFKGFDLDNDLRKKYNGKLFIIIFQLTSDGKMRGGSDAQFDGDIITFIEKHENFNDNYIYHDKNRFAVVPIHLTKYNIASQSLVKPEEEAPVEAPKSLVFS